MCGVPGLVMRDDLDTSDSAGYADQISRPVVFIVCVFVCLGFWSFAYGIYRELVAAGVLP